MLIDGRLLPSGTRLRADVVVIGAGPAGITVTQELAGAGHHVVLLEAGGRPDERSDDDALRGEASGAPFDMVRSRSSGFGGTSTRWTPRTGLRIRTLDVVDYESRAGRAGSWPFGGDVLAPYYERACATVGCTGDYISGRTVDGDSATPLSWPGGPELAMFEFADHDCVLKRFDAFAIDPRLDVVVHATVRAITLGPDGASAASVAVVCPNRNEFSVEAPVFVVAAGGIDNARILLASPGRTGAGLGNEHDNVGRWFMDHLSVDGGVVVPCDGRPLSAEMFLDRSADGERYQPMLWLGNDVARREGLPNAAFWVNDLEPSYMTAGVGAARSLKEALNASPRRNVGHHLRATARGFGDLVAFARTKTPWDRQPPVTGLRIMIEQVPDRESRITLARARDRLGIPRVDLAWRISDDDLHTIRRHQDVLSSVLERRGVATIVDRFEPDRHTSPIMTNHHHIGTTRMHASARHGVVDPDCRLHGAPNVFVVGSSVFPTGGYVNPTMTIVALAHRAADAVRDDLGPVRVTAPADEPSSP